MAIAHLPDNVSFDDYIGGGCGLPAAVHILERAALRPADTVLVQGTGAVGLGAIALARLGGAGTIYAIGGAGGALIWRGGWARIRCSAAHCPLNVEDVRAHAGGEGIRCRYRSCWLRACVRRGLELVRDGGRYVIAGHYTDAGPSSVNVHHQINRKHLDIRGCWGSEPDHFLRALALLERYAANVPWRDIGGPTYALTALNDALARNAEAMRITKAIVDPWM